MEIDPNAIKLLKLVFVEGKSWSKCAPPFALTIAHAYQLQRSAEEQYLSIDIVRGACSFRLFRACGQRCEMNLIRNVIKDMVALYRGVCGHEAVKFGQYDYCVGRQEGASKRRILATGGANYFAAVINFQQTAAGGCYVASFPGQVRVDI